MLAISERRSQHVGAMRASLLSAHADGAYAASVTNMHHEKTYEVVLADSLLANSRLDDDSPCDASDPWILSRAPRILCATSSLKSRRVLSVTGGVTIANSFKFQKLQV
jgi:hypothetical protein